MHFQSLGCALSPFDSSSHKILENIDHSSDYNSSRNDGFFQSGGNRNLLPPVPIYKVSPKHPDDLYARAIEGETVIAVTVDIFGGATKPKVETATHPDFGIAAYQAASEWIFEPPTKDDVPIESSVKLPFVFEIAFEHKLNV